MSTCPECNKALTSDDAYGHDCETWPECLCPACDLEDGFNPGDDCMRNFCAICRAELGYESTWPDSCGQCTADVHQQLDLA